MWILACNIDLRCFVVKQLLLWIYALFGVQCEVLKIALAYKKWQITGMVMIKSIFIYTSSKKSGLRGKMCVTKKKSFLSVALAVSLHALSGKIRKELNKDAWLHCNCLWRNWILLSALFSFLLKAFLSSSQWKVLPNKTLLFSMHFLYICKVVIESKITFEVGHTLKLARKLQDAQAEKLKSWDEKLTR